MKAHLEKGRIHMWERKPTCSRREKARRDNV